MLLPAISETTVGLSLPIYRWRALLEENLNILKYFINTLLLLNSERMKNMHLCPKGPVFLKFSQMKVLFFANCEFTTISMLICLKSELRVKERDLFDCSGRKQ